MKDHWEIELINNFSKNLQIFYTKFCYGIQKNNECQNCKSFKNYYCKGITSSTGGKYCLSNKLANGCENEDSKIDAYIQSLRLWLTHKAQHLPSTSTLYKLSKIFNCTIDDFFQDNATTNINIFEKFLGGYYFYSLSPNNHYHLNYLYIINDGIKLKAYCKFNITSLDNYKNICESVDDDNYKNFFNSNDYMGTVEILQNEAIILNLQIIRPDMDDKLVMFLLDTYELQSKIIFEEKEKINNKPDKIQLSAGIFSSLSRTVDDYSNKDIISFNIILSKKFLDLENENDRTEMNKIFEQKQKVCPSTLYELIRYSILKK